jgi:pimeloyl-ACP methyl ester carboxylesterase
VLATLVVGIVGAAALAAASGFAYQTLGSSRDRRRFPPLGNLVDVNGRKLHFYSVGEGSPAVIFEAALGGSCIGWIPVQREVARFTKAVSYDRAGMGWSDPDTRPHTLLRAAEDLHSLLDAARIQKPVVLVGHSYGGLVVQLYAALYPADLAGMVLIDPAHPEEWAHPSDWDTKRLLIGAKLSRRGAWIARFGIARLTAFLATVGAQRIARLNTLVASGGILRGQAERILAPVHRVPPEYRPMLRAMWTHPKYYATLGSQMETLSESAREFPAITNYGDLPLAVISAASGTPFRIELNEKLAQLSSRGRHIVAPDCGHWIQLDQPQCVSDAISQVVDQARAVVRR